MRPTPCPSRLEELIRLANLTPDSEARRNLQTIARAFRAKRRQQNESDFIEIESRFAIRIELEDGKIDGVFDELALALNQTESENSVDRIRECPICSEIFWAGRSDKEACTRHADRWRKSEQRRREKEAKERRAKNRARRKERQAEKPFQLSITTATILDAIFDRHRTSEHIADYCYSHLYKNKYSTSVFSGVYRKVNVDRGLKALEDAGYLTTGGEQTSANRQYAPTEKAKRLRREMLHPATKHNYFRFAVAESATD